MLNLSWLGKVKVCASFRFWSKNRVVSLHTQVPEGFPQLCWCAGSTPAGYSVEHTRIHFLYTAFILLALTLIAHPIVDVTNVRAKHCWIDIRTNSTRCLKNTLLQSSSQKTRSPIFPCSCSRASSSRVQLHLDNRFLGNSNSPLIQTKSDSLGFTSYIYCKFNLENPKPRSQQCFVASFLCISHQWSHSRQAISCFVCPKFDPQMLCTYLFLDWCAVPYLI